MPTNIRILAFSGSARRESLNTKLLTVAITAARTAGAEVTWIDLNAWPLPLYHGDLEATEGLPANATKLVELAMNHQALLIASPEYNGFITPLLKNTLDWMSRADADPFADKVAAVVSASPGVLGGMRSQILAKQLLGNLGCLVVPAGCTVGRAHEAFAADGALKDTRAAKSVEVVVAQLIQTAGKLTAPL